MKGTYRRIIAGMFLVCASFLFVAFNGHAGEKQRPVDRGIKIQRDKEILVARDVGGGLPFSLIRWCGNAGLLIYGDEFGAVWAGLDGNKATISTKGTDYPRDCSPDGKWVIYEDRDSGRIYKDKRGRIPENIVDEGPGWHGFVMDMYRYEIKTGTRQKFAVVRDDSGSLVSPDGTRVLLGNRHDSVIEMPEPKWEAVWLTNEWDYNPTFWFADSSGIATLIWHNGHDFGVEFFGRNGWAREFSLEEINGNHKAVRSFSLEAVDKDKRFCFSTVESPPEVKRAGWAKYRFFRCEITNKELFCEKIGELDEAGKRISSLYLLPNGDVIFGRWREDSCIRRLKPGQTHAECIADTRYGGDTYEDVYLIGVSPDGKWMALRRGKTPPKPGNRFYGYQYDLFVKELSGD